VAEQSPSWADRERLEGRQKSLIGYLVEIQAIRYRDEHEGSLDGFTNVPFPRTIQHQAEILLILNDLDFQIETMDIVEE